MLLVALLASAPASRATALYDTLAILGGDEALSAVIKAASSGPDEARDAALRALAGWQDFAAAKPLLAIAADPQIGKVHSVLALQGVARLIQAADKGTPAERVETALAGLKTAQRPEEKRSMLAALASVADPKAVEALKLLLADPALKADAAQSALALAESLPRPGRTLAKSLAQAVKDSGPSPEMLGRAEAILRR